MRYKMDIGKPVFSRYSDIAAVGHEINAFRGAKFYVDLNNNVNKKPKKPKKSKKPALPSIATVKFKDKSSRFPA